MILSCPPTTKEARRPRSASPFTTSAGATEALLRFLGRGEAFNACCDLHIHSNISDGSDSFKDIVEQAARREMTHIAFTNHDTTVGLDFAVETAGHFGIVALGGIEVSAWDVERKRKVHVLGYGLRSDSPAIRALCRDLLEKRRANTCWQMDRLLEAGYEVDIKKAAELSQHSTSFYKQHLMAALTDAAYGSAAYSCLSRGLFKGTGICARDISYVDAREAVGAIVADGGVAVLAHPGQLDSYGIVPALVECGLRGIERFHPDHGPADWQRCAELEKRHNLFHTGGSDYHGTFNDTPHIGFRGQA
ncbi:MAG: PHP domain-containing protein [Eggerthellaceae bacterium]|nr:PHP domain-containing protein [Eggerthellaceae bacterium]